MMEAAEVERRMRPGMWTESGFLTSDASLAEVLATDAEVLNDLGVQPETIGRRLQELVADARESDRFVPVRTGEYEVEVHRQRGFITCPWAPEEFERCTVGHGSRPTANRFVIIHRPSGQRLEGYELSIHLIRDHSFFGGPGTPFRLEARDAVSLVGENARDP